MPNSENDNNNNNDNKGTDNAKGNDQNKNEDKTDYKALYATNKAEFDNLKNQNADLLKKLEDIENSKLTESEKLQKKIDELDKNFNAEKERNLRLARESNIKEIATSLGFRNIKDALNNITDDVKDVTAHLTQVLKDNPYYKKDDKNIGTPSNPANGGNNTKNGFNKLMNDLLRS